MELPTPPDKMVFDGTELIARVGSDVILAADVLYEVNKMMERFLAQNVGKEVPPEMIAQGRIIFMKQNLKRLIETKLLFIEANQERSGRGDSQKSKSSSTNSSTNCICAR